MFSHVAWIPSPDTSVIYPLVLFHTHWLVMRQPDGLIRLFSAKFPKGARKGQMITDPRNFSSGKSISMRIFIRKWGDEVPMALYIHGDSWNRYQCPFKTTVGAWGVAHDRGLA